MKSIISAVVFLASASLAFGAPMQKRQNDTAVPTPTTSILTGVELSSTPSILTGVVLSTPSILTGVTLSTPSILTGVTRSTSVSILTGVTRSSQSILTGVTQSSVTSYSPAHPTKPPCPPSPPAPPKPTGPSGVLNFPWGNAAFNNNNGIGTICVNYTTVTWSQGAQTVAIDLALQGLPADKTAPYFQLATGYIGAAYDSATNGTITGAFTPPAAACGWFELIVNEQQYYQGNLINFRSAAPSIYVDCSCQS